MSAQDKEFNKLLEFFSETDKFKDVYRQIARNEDEYENDAEHTWHCCLVALVLHKKLKTQVDLEKTLKLLIVHDLPEIYTGDVLAFDEKARVGKSDRENAAAKDLFGLLGETDREELQELWCEYEAGKTSEAGLAKAIDKLQAMISNIITSGKAWKHHKITEDMVRSLKSEKMDFDPFIRSFHDHLMLVAKDQGCFYEGG